MYRMSATAPAVGQLRHSTSQLAVAGNVAKLYMDISSTEIKGNSLVLELVNWSCKPQLASTRNIVPASCFTLRDAQGIPISAKHELLDRLSWVGTQLAEVGEACMMHAVNELWHHATDDTKTVR